MMVSRQLRFHEKTDPAKSTSLSEEWTPESREPKAKNCALETDS